MASNQQPLRFKDLYIAKPCSANWQEMDAQTGGRFCNQCQKKVVDFTDKTEAELNAIVAELGPKLCGRFLASEIGKAPVEVSFFKPQFRWRKGAVAAFFLLAMWQVPTMGKAETKKIEYAAHFHHAQGKYGFSMNTLASDKLKGQINDHDGKPILDDIRLTVTFPSGKKRILKTKKGKFTLQLPRKQKPEDTLHFVIAEQKFDVGHEIRRYGAFSVDVTLDNEGLLLSTRVCVNATLMGDVVTEEMSILMGFAYIPPPDTPFHALKGEVPDSAAMAKPRADGVSKAQTPSQPEEQPSNEEELVWAALLPARLKKRRMPKF